jgi:hypothetical protein
MGSVISPKVTRELKLDIVDTIEITGINGNSLAKVAVVSVRFPNGADIRDLRVAVCDMFPGNEMIIGMDIISQMDFAITNGGGQTQFSIAIPPFDTRIDFAKRRNYE